MSRANAIFKNVMLLTVSSLTLRSIQMGFQVYLSGRIGAEGMGLFQLIMSVYALAATLGMSGIRVTTTCLVAEEVGRRNPAGIHKVMRGCMLYAFVFSVAAGAILFNLSEFIGQAWIGDERSILSLKLLSMGLPFMSMASVIAGYFTATGKIGRYVALELIERGLYIVLTVFFLKLTDGMGLGYACASIIAGSLISGIFGFIMQLTLFIRDGRTLPETAEKTPVTRRMFSIAMPIAVNDYARSGLSTVENMLIPRGLKAYSGSGETALATYGIIHGMVFPVIMFPSTVLYSVSELLVPELTESRAAGNLQRVRRIVSRVLNMGLIFAAGVAGVLLALSGQLGQLIYNSAEASYYIRIFAPLVLMLYMDSLVDGMQKGLGQHVYTARYNTLTSILDVILLFLLLPKYGIGGYFFVFTLTHAVNFYLSISRLFKVTDLQLDVKFLLKVVLCIFASGFIMNLFDPFTQSMPLFASTLVKGVLMILFYMFLLNVTSTVDKGDISYIKHVLFGQKCYRQHSEPNNSRIT